MIDFEKLGTFYLGKTYDISKGARTDDLLLYDAKDLVTHALCVGMTGSGKTGLCLDLLEEAAIDGIPALIIDPKGDLGNLMLTFPNLAPSDFRPWINESDAQTKGLSPDAFSQQQADLWRKGLESWHQSGERIARFRSAADVLVYTPGSNAGLPVSILKSFDCPPFEVMDDAELLRDRINTTVSSLLGLAGISADPIRSREHILLSTILMQTWQAGKSVDLGGIIALVQNPGFSKVGVLDLEAFFPSKDRFELAMTLNNLLASPQFAAWTQGEALDVGKMLYGPTGKPRLAIVSIAHLDDAQRMFFVALLLNQVLGWVRQQSGTTSLRAILYMDEIAGYFPPVANPPSKQALLTLMKQARAFGLGVVLATQNPVDLDYKGLSNAGTWFIGRLQTEQDKARLLDGLEGAMATASKQFDRAHMEKVLSGLAKRVFLMNNVHEDGPVVFESRWALSYLRGPLTRGQIKQLMDPIKAGKPAAPSVAEASTTSVAAATVAAAPFVAATPAGNAAQPQSAAGTAPATQRPVLAPDVPQYFIPVRGVKPAGARLEYRPMLLGFAWVHFLDKKAGVDVDQPASMLTPFGAGPVPIDWDAGMTVELTDKDVEREPAEGAAFAMLPSEAAKAKSYADWSKKLVDTLFRTRQLELLRSDQLEALSLADESERDFRIRLQQLAREQRDAAVEKLRARHASKVTTLTERIRKAEQKVEVQQAQAKNAKVSSALSFGAAILGGLLGGRKIASAGNVGRAATAARTATRAMSEGSDVDRAREDLESAQQQLAQLEEQIKLEADAIAAKFDPAAESLDKLTIRPKKTDIRIDAVVLAWTPHWIDAGGATPAWA
jgi:hypothetical protein